MKREHGHVDHHPVHDTNDTFKIGTCVRAKQFVKRVGYDKLTHEQDMELVKKVCHQLKVPETDVLISGDDICGEPIDWNYFPTAFTKYVEGKGKEWDMGSIKLGVSYHPPFESPKRQVPYLERPTIEEAKQVYKQLIATGFKTGNMRQVFYTPNNKPFEVFVVIGKRIARIGKYVRGFREFGEYFGPALEKQTSVQIYTLSKGLYGPTFEATKDDLILMEYAIPAMSDRHGNKHNWRVCYEWEYEKMHEQTFSSITSPIGCPQCHSTKVHFNKDFVTTLSKPWNCNNCGWGGSKEELVYEGKKV